MEELIAKRYAKALWDTYDDKETAAAVLGALGEALASPKAAQIVASPVVSAEQKTELVLAALDDKADKALRNFVKVLGEHGRLGLIPAVAKVLRTQLQRASNRYEGVLLSASEVSKEDVAKLEKRLSDYTGATVALRTQQSDVDGLRVRIEDLGIEVNFSKTRVKEQLIEFIKKSL